MTPKRQPNPDRIPRGLAICGLGLIGVVVVGFIALVADWHVVATIAGWLFGLSPVWIIAVLVAHSDPPIDSIEEYLASLEWSRVPRCEKCGYETAGLPESAPCPECGKPIAFAWSTPPSVIDPKLASQYEQPYGIRS